MRVAILGAGYQGAACAFDLGLYTRNLQEVTLVDLDPLKAERAAEQVQKWIKAAPPGGSRANQATGQIAQAIGDRVDRIYKVNHKSVDVSKHAQLVAFLRPYDVVVSAVPYFLNPIITRAAIDAQTHMVDMGGNTDLVFQQRELSERARAAGVTVLPDCGLAPGMANLLAVDGINRLRRADHVRIRVGGLPQEPLNALNYHLFFSIHGLINEYMGQAVVLREGKRLALPTLSELETLQFEGSHTELEAFLTLGGLSTLPWTYEGRVQTMDYKTIRYPGHCAQIQAMAELGLLDEAPVTIGGVSISPREVFAHQAAPRLMREGCRDVVLVRVEVEGLGPDQQPLRHVYQLTDLYDEHLGLTAMMRCTAFPVSIITQMLVEGPITARGVLSLEEAVPTEAFISELARRNLVVDHRCEALGVNSTPA